MAWATILKFIDLLGKTTGTVNPVLNWKKVMQLKMSAFMVILEAQLLERYSIFSPAVACFEWIINIF